MCLDKQLCPFVWSQKVFLNFGSWISLLNINILKHFSFFFFGYLHIYCKRFNLPTSSKHGHAYFYNMHLRALEACPVLVPTWYYWTPGWWHCRSSVGWDYCNILSTLSSACEHPPVGPRQSRLVHAWNLKIRVLKNALDRENNALPQATQTLKKKLNIISY